METRLWKEYLQSAEESFRGEMTLHCSALTQSIEWLFILSQSNDIVKAIKCYFHQLNTLSLGITLKVFSMFARSNLSFLMGILPKHKNKALLLFFGGRGGEIVGKKRLCASHAQNLFKTFRSVHCVIKHLWMKIEKFGDRATEGKQCSCCLTSLVTLVQTC